MQADISSYFVKSLSTFSYIAASKLIFCMMLLVAMVLIGQGSYIHIKAQVAQILMASAWEQGKQTKVPQKPWPWADTTVIGKISYLKRSYYVLSGESGRNLAFGPSLMSASSALSERGNSVIAAHRDTHFKALQYLQLGDEIKIEHFGGTRRYKVSEAMVVSSNDVGIMAASNVSMLTLITCYPFNTLHAEPSLRYALRAIAI